MRKEKTADRFLGNRYLTDLELVLRIADMPTHYTPAPVILGWETEFFVATAGVSPTGGSAALFGTKGGRIEYAVDQQECGDSSNGRYKAEKNGRLQILVTLNYYEKHNVNSTGIFDVDEIAMAVYPNGIAAPSGETQKQPWIIPSFMLGPITQDWDQDGKMNGTLTGKSNGSFTAPTN